MSAHYTIKGGKELEQEHRGYLLSQAMTIRCSWCPFTVTASASQAIAEAKAHRERRHPRKRHVKRAVEHYRRYNAPIVANGKTIEDNLNGARAQGAAAWTRPAPAVQPRPCVEPGCILNAVGGKRAIYCHQHQQQRRRREEAA